MNTTPSTVPEILLRRRGLVFLEGAGAPLEARYLEAVELELAELGYAVSSDLRAALSRLSLEELARQKSWIVGVLARHRGADQKHKPLFRKFPDAIPESTHELWVQKVLSHFLQTEDQACLFCRRIGTTHVLDPCLHVVCDHCFDGENYSACPICEHHVDTSSPFFRPSPSDRQNFPPEPTRFQVLHLGESIHADARALFESFCRRPQAMSPADRDDLICLVRESKMHVLGWLPDEIPVKENVAIVFGSLFSVCDPAQVLPAATPMLRTATDVLRLIAAYSGADPALQGEVLYRRVTHVEPRARWWGRVLEMLGAPDPHRRSYPVAVPMQVRRFKVGKLTRPLRRALLAILERFDAQLLTEDMLRHRSYWVWLGEFLHPGEYEKRFPKVAAAFRVVRQKGPDGTPAPAFSTYSAKLEAAAAARDALRFASLLSDRPGELARRFDHALRLAGDDQAARREVLETFSAKLGVFATPVLLTLYAHLPRRLEPVETRVFWPKGGVGRFVTAPDARPPLSADVIQPAVAGIRRELLRRYAERPPVKTVVIDRPLADVMVPFNERTASRAAVSLPRGSSLEVPEGKMLRLFLHWCQPERGGFETDLDLSVAFYDADWKYSGLCSYHQLSFPEGRGVEPIAHSAGDLRDAPFPEGATELVDLDLVRARAAGLRYAVMVVNAYAGMPFALLERVFAGIMLRERAEGLRFDPRTVELKFSLAGDHGIYLPLVLDLDDRRLHWLDVFSPGEFQFNNVHTSNRAITTICPELVRYFGSGQRMNMFDLGLLHAAARAQEVYIRGAGDQIRRHTRPDGASHEAFLERLESDEGQPVSELPAFADPTLAVLFRGDATCPIGAEIYALFPEQLSPNLAASDLIG